MKKIILIFVILVIVLISYTYYSYLVAVSEEREVIENNKQYEQFCEDKILGTDLATLINKAIDSNERNDLEKDENGVYKDNSTNSINIYIKFKDADETFDMERIYKLGIDRFIMNYNQMEFKCSKIEYHQKTSNIKYMYFEEI